MDVNLVANGEVTLWQDQLLQECLNRMGRLADLFSGYFFGWMIYILNLMCCFFKL